MNAAVVEPAAMTTDDGIVTLDEDRMPVITVRPWLRAGADALTMHEAEPGVMIVAGEQVTAVMKGGIFSAACNTAFWA